MISEFMTKEERRRLLAYLIESVDDDERTFINERLNPDPYTEEVQAQFARQIAEKLNNPTNYAGSGVVGKKLI